MTPEFDFRVEQQLREGRWAFVVTIVVIYTTIHTPKGNFAS